MEPAAALIPEDRHGRILAELAGMGLELARDLRERALAAETAEEATRLARAFQSISRGVRQTLALELKVARFRTELERDIRTAADETARKTAAVREPALHRRREAIGSQVERLIYTEHDGYEFDEAEAERLQWALSDWMEAAAERDDFTTADLDDQILQACEALSLDPDRFALLDAAARPAANPDTPDGDGDDVYDDDEDAAHPAAADSS